MEFPKASRTPMLLLISLALVPNALAATLTVDPADSSAYATIKGAIMAASSGDTIEVAAGTYSNCIDTSGYDLTISSTDGSLYTTIDGQGTCDAAVEIQNGETVSLTGFTINNSNARGVYIDSSSVTFDDVIIENAGSSSTSGGAIYITLGTLDVSNGTLSGNVAYYGGHMYVAEGSEVILDNVILEDGYSVYNGGGI